MGIAPERLVRLVFYSSLFLFFSGVEGAIIQWLPTRNGDNDNELDVELESLEFLY